MYTGSGGGQNAKNATISPSFSKTCPVFFEISDVTIKVPEVETYRVQELHLPVYHALCAMVEETFFDK